MRWSIWVGYDSRQPEAMAVAAKSLGRHCDIAIPVRWLVLDRLRALRAYYRPMTVDENGQIWDEISRAPCSTEFAISRFLVPHLAGRDGLALYMDCDVLIRADVRELFEWIEAQPRRALWCVHHNHVPNGDEKMTGFVQTEYPRKNWSSVMVFDLGHQANAPMTVYMANTMPGRQLHRFCWLNDDEIGELPVEWNWLAGHSDPDVDPKIVHFTDGIPWIPGHQNAPYADEWRQYV
jgi:hypothetical protein